MDNLYLSAKFVKAAYNHERKVLIAGVTRKSGRGLPASVLQEEEKNKNKQEAVRGTVKVSVLKGDPDCPAMVAASVYDTKPVHFLSMMCESIEWVMKERLVYNVDSERMETLRFLRLNINDFYNNNMGHVDVSDQLRNTYRFDHWLRQWKWWWSIWLWSLGVLLVNAYATYQLVMEEAGVPKNKWKSHYTFRKEIAMAWVNSNEPTIGERHKAKESRIMALAGDDSTATTGKRSAATESSKGSRKRRKTVNATPQQQQLQSTKSDRAPTLKDNILAMKDGPLARRLVKALGHYPERLHDRGARCAVHRWCAGIEVKADVYKCSHCRVNLCVDCFRIFHCKIDLVGHKEDLKKQFLEAKQKAANVKAAPSLYAKKPPKK